MHLNSCRDTADSRGDQTELAFDRIVLVHVGKHADKKKRLSLFVRKRTPSANNDSMPQCIMDMAMEFSEEYDRSVYKTK